MPKKMMKMRKKKRMRNKVKFDIHRSLYRVSKQQSNVN
jgi:hypothetical protein